MKWLVRAAVLAMLAGSVAIGWLAGVSRDHNHDLPGEALGSPFFLRLEHGFLAFVILLVVLVVAVQGLLHGVLPSKVSQNSVEYEPVAAAADSAIGELQKKVDRRLDVLTELTRRQQEDIEMLKRRMDPH